MDQIKNNDINQIMYGDLPEIVDDSFLDIEKVNDKKKTIYLSNDDIRERYIKEIYSLVKKLIEGDMVKDFTMEKMMEGLG
jgi:hypothetical protein